MTINLKPLFNTHTNFLKSIIKPCPPMISTIFYQFTHRFLHFIQRFSHHKPLLQIIQHFILIFKTRQIRIRQNANLHKRNNLLIIIPQRNKTIQKQSFKFFKIFRINAFHQINIFPKKIYYKILPG